MTTINKKTRTLFFTTSPRTPQRMIPEIELLTNMFDQEKWDKTTQKQFMEALTQQDFYNGNTNPKDPALSARDRINRSPKALGFVDLSPTIKLTSAGEEYIFGNLQEETLLRQLLKFQLPSPFHKPSRHSSQFFNVKPYLEIIRLVRHFGTLAFDELMLFGMQLTDFQKFDLVVKKIEDFRKDKTMKRGHYRRFFNECCRKEIEAIYHDAIQNGETYTRETRDASLARFIKTKKSNMRDYADACFRYLRATEIVAISQIGHSLSIPRDRMDDVDYILEHVDRRPCFINDESKYKQYLFDSTTPKLLSDDPEVLRKKIEQLDPEINTSELSLSELKERELVLRVMRCESLIDEQIRAIKDYQLYDDIQSVFDSIIRNDYYDNPLMFEWNTWRAMTMLDGGLVEANYKVDDEGQPLSTAAGNTADITCDYGSFRLAVEVTLQKGQRQYESEAEPVARHLGRLKELTEQNAYCLFIAPTINPATISHFYALHKINIALYGGKSIILPMELNLFKKIIEASYEATYVPEPHHIESLFLESLRVSKIARDENEWYSALIEFALNWPGAEHDGF